MGLSNFPSPAEGVLPVLVMNTVMSVAILKNLLRSFLQLVGAISWVNSNLEENQSTNEGRMRRMRGVLHTKFKNLYDSSKNSSSNSNSKNSSSSSSKDSIFECCVCLCKFEDEEEVSELSCKHFFHRKCLDKWFDNHHSTCPLCRSIH